MVQIAMVGCLKAFRRWDRTRSALSTYARHFARGELRHYVRDHLHLMTGTRHAHSHGHAMPPVLSLEGLAVAPDGTMVGWDHLPALQTVGDFAFVELCALLRRALPTSDYAVLLLNKVFGFTQQELGAWLGVSQKHISRIYRRAKGRAAHALSA